MNSSSPLFNWLDERASGILLHPTSLPGEGGIGTLGSAAFVFLDLLREGGFKYWQVCPLGPTGYGDSPYQSFSSFAGNPYLIDLDPLAEAGLLQNHELNPLRQLPHQRVDYGSIYELKWPLLKLAFERWEESNCQWQPYGKFSSFLEKHSSWLSDFTFFQALKAKHGGQPWWEWPAKDKAIKSARKGKKDQATQLNEKAQAFYQYLFFGQWNQIRQAARERNIEIIGDLPIFVSRDSADAWAQPELFQMDPETLHPIRVAGCPPDYFSETGQFWGNPVYDWEKSTPALMDWWKERLRVNFLLADVIRIDHFRGLEGYWSIPAEAPDATHGEWVPGPGSEFFKPLAKLFPEGKIIAEDLGLITPEVRQLLAQTGLPGMAILQFAFGDDADNLYLPHNLVPNQVVYTGTHDNDTSRSWYAQANEKARDHLRRYLRVSGEDVSWDMIRAALGSVCRLAVLPLTDILNLSSEGRFNTPGKAEGNWQWRCEVNQLEGLRQGTLAYLQELNKLYGREK